MHHHNPALTSFYRQYFTVFFLEYFVRSHIFIFHHNLFSFSLSLSGYEKIIDYIFENTLRLNMKRINNDTKNHSNFLILYLEKNYMQIRVSWILNITHKKNCALLLWTYISSNSNIVAYNIPSMWVLLLLFLDICTFSTWNVCVWANEMMPNPIN